MKLSRLAFAAALMFLAAYPAVAQDSNPNTYNETRISNIEEQLRVLNGRIEQVEFAVRRMDQTIQRMQADNDARLTRLEQEQAAQSAAPQPVVAPQPAQPAPQPAATAPAQAPVSIVAPPPVTDATGTLGAIKVQNGKVVGGVNAPQATPLPAVPADYGLTPEEQYERAFGLLRAASYPEAEVAFKSFIDKNPKDKLIDNAKYWYGETLYVRGKFDEAAVAFADAYQQNPRGTKAPDSLLKLGMSLGALNKIPDACVTLLELKTKYPGAAATIKARAEDERAHLKCPAK